jgi:hypothetical protein
MKNIIPLLTLSLIVTQCGNSETTSTLSGADNDNHQPTPKAISLTQDFNSDNGARLQLKGTEFFEYLSDEDRRHLINASGNIMVPGSTTRVEFWYQGTAQWKDGDGYSGLRETMRCNMFLHKKLYEIELPSDISFEIEKTEAVDYSHLELTALDPRLSDDAAVLKVFCTRFSKVVERVRPSSQRIEFDKIDSSKLLILAPNLACIFSPTIRVPEGKTNPPLNCAFDQKMEGYSQEKEELYQKKKLKIWFYSN